MAYYDYHCPKCGAMKEVERSIKSKETIVVCECRYIMTRVWSVPSIKFNGEGWQSNDVKGHS